MHAQAEYNNPIKQDIKKGELRHYHDAIPYNYGMLPQTWEDPAASSSVLPGIGVRLPLPYGSTCLNGRNTVQGTQSESAPSCCDARQSMHNLIQSAVHMMCRRAQLSPVV